MWRTPCGFTVSTSLAFCPSLLAKICSECLYVYNEPTSECAYRSCLCKQRYRTSSFRHCMTSYRDFLDSFTWHCGRRLSLKSLYFLGCEEGFHFYVEPEGSSRWTHHELAKFYIFMIYFNIILPHTPCCPKYSLLLRFLTEILCDFLILFVNARRKQFNS